MRGTISCLCWESFLQRLDDTNAKYSIALPDDRRRIIGILLCTSNLIRRTDFILYIDKSSDLYQVLVDNGFDPRKEIGRDNIIYLKLKEAFKCPANLGLKKFLELKKVPVEKFISTFFKISEPFSQMYQDVFNLFRRYDIHKSTESIKIQLEDDVSIDLAFFKKTVELQQVMRTSMVEYPEWSRSQFSLFRDCLYTILESEDYSSNYPKIPYEVSKIPKNIKNDKLNQILDFSSAVLNEVANKINKYRSEGKQFTYDIGKTENDLYNLDEWVSQITFSCEEFPGLLKLYGTVIDQIRLGTMGNNKINESHLQYEHLISILKPKHYEKDLLISTFIELLEMPFWKYRWYLYEVWVTSLTLKSLEKFDLKVTQDSKGNFPLYRGKASSVATFEASNKKSYAIHSQLETPVFGIPKRRGICPDIRVVEEGKDTLLIIECKQRKKMDQVTLQKNVALYELGCQSSNINIFVNYDVFPEGIKSKRTELFSELNPSFSYKIENFKDLIKKNMKSLGIKPKPKYEKAALLIDISGSMVSFLNSTESYLILKEVMRSFEDEFIFYFNDKLIEKSFIEDAERDEWIWGNALGGTNIDASIKMLLNKYNYFNKIYLVTDESEVSDDLKNQIILLSVNQTYQWSEHFSI